MCGRYTFSAKSDAEMIQQVQESLEARDMDVKTGVVNPGDVPAVIAGNRRLEPQCLHEAVRCLIPAHRYFEWHHLEKKKQKYEIAPNGSAGFCLAGYTG